MKNKRESIKTITRGGQTFLHNLRMINQVLNKAFLWSLPMTLGVSIFWFLMHTTVYDRSVVMQFLEGSIAMQLGARHHPQWFTFEDGERVRIYSHQLVAAPFVQSTARVVFHQLQNAGVVFLWTEGILLFGIMGWLKRRGRLQTDEKHLKGDALCIVKKINKQIYANEEASELTLGKGNLMIPKDSEVQHFLFHGTTGTGKSTAICRLLDQIRERGDRAIIYDKSCSLVRTFYQKNQDVLLNPLDARSRDWNLWKECRDKNDFESLASALIPMPVGSHDPFWVNAARSVFATSAYHLKQTPKISILLQYLFSADVKGLEALLQGSEAESLMSEKTDKMAISIKSVLATYLKSLSYIQDEQAPFSIRQWIQEENKQWLFLTSQGDQHEVLKPLITAWLDIAVNALLSLRPQSDRRVWLILDELASLNQLPYLTAGLSEARKFGGCFVVGIQSYAQLAKLYGFEGAREISSLLNTRLMFRVPDPDVALWSSKNLGSNTIESVQEGISYGANTMRDGVSVHRVERERALVTPSEILQLPNFYCYARLAGNYPITKLKLSMVQRPIISDSFVTKVIKPIEWSAPAQKIEAQQVVKAAESVIPKKVSKRKKQSDDASGKLPALPM